MKNHNLLVKRYLLTFHFDKFFEPDNLASMVESVEHLCCVLGCSARKVGIRFKAIYTIVRGQNGHHVHMITNWLPTVCDRRGLHRTSVQIISRIKIEQILQDNFFYLVSQVHGIKRIKSDAKKVERYIHEQPKQNQQTIYSGAYDTAPSSSAHSEQGLKFYYSAARMLYQPNYKQDIAFSKKIAVYYALLFAFILISLILLTLL